MATILEIDNLSIGYNQSKNHKTVANKLTGKLNKGEMTCLLGANGKGKSTLMKTICGFLKPLAGNVVLDGVNLLKLSEKEMAKKVAVVLTEKIIAPNATVWELVSYGRSPFTGFMGRLTPEDKDMVTQAINKCGIGHKTHSLLSTLSDGERQKATIAKALAQDTPFIILDEPTAFLDLPARVEIMQLLRRLASKMNKSILMSTHDLDLALQLSDRLWLLDSEQINSGSPEDLLLSNSFQSMFNKGGIEFDNKTGMFKVQYEHQITFPVQGHGFEYVLLRRAFARKGIKLCRNNEDDAVWIKVQNDSDIPYILRTNNDEEVTFSFVEDIVKHVLKMIIPK